MGKKPSKFLQMQSKVKTTYRARAIHSDGSEEIFREYKGRGWLDARSRFINVLKGLTDTDSFAQREGEVTTIAEGKGNATKGSARES